MASDQRRSVALSQNFLKSPGLARHLVERAGLAPTDTVLEIGPGRGALTRHLAERCHHLIAVEKDPVLAHRLSVKMRAIENVVIYAADVLDLPLPLTPYKVFANIPFNITSEIVTRLTRAANPPEEAYLVVQREAADRFIGRPRETLSSVLLKPWFDVSVVHRFRGADFVPPPRVAVVLIRFSKRGPPLVPEPDAQSYRDLVIYGFTAWQPSIGEAYARVFGRERFQRIARRIDLSPRSQPSAVPLSGWIALFEYLRDRCPPSVLMTVQGAEQRLREQQARLRKVHRTRAGRTAMSRRGAS